MNLRVEDHPILGKLKLGAKVNVTLDGNNVEAYTGEPVAVALLAAGKKTLRRTVKTDEPRGIFCAIGLCTDCVMTVNGKSNVRTCITPIEKEMVIQTQAGSGRWKEGANNEE